MSPSERSRALEQILAATAKAHHQAYLATDGYDPAWPDWYARHMQAEMNSALSTNLSTTQLAELLEIADREYTNCSATEDWKAFYTSFLLAHISQ